MRQKKERRDKPIPVALKPETIARLDALSEKMGENRSVAMRIAMRIGMASLEKSFAVAGEVTPEMLSEEKNYKAIEPKAFALNDRPNSDAPHPAPTLPPVPEWALYHPESMVLTDREGLVLWVNDAFTALCGYDRAALRGHKPGQFLQRGDADQPAVKAMRTAIRLGQFASVSITNYHRDGTPYEVQIVLGPLKQGGRVTHFAAVERLASHGKEADLRATLDRFLQDLAVTVEKTEKRKG